MTQSGHASVKTLDLVYIALFAVLIAICSWISIPAIVPFTLQTFGVFCAVGFLGGKRGALSALVYILLGLVGLPVFAGFQGGVGALFGAAGGYIIGFLFFALTYLLFTRILGQMPKQLLRSSTIVMIVAMLAGLLILYAFGTAWFMIVYTRGTGQIALITALSYCVFPFIIPDLIKMGLAVLLVKRLKRHLKI